MAGEELGLIGAGAIIALFAVVLFRGLRIAVNARDAFGRLVATGIVCWFAFQAFENIGMTLGIMPVTGLPLPFVSYGGSSMFAGLLAVGLLQNIHLRSHRLLDLPQPDPDTTADMSGTLLPAPHRPPAHGPAGRPMTRFVSLPLALAAALTLSLTACGGDDKESRHSTPAGDHTGTECDPSGTERYPGRDRSPGRRPS